MKIFMDCEFTGLHQRTTLISIALVTDQGDQFYAELLDYDVNQVQPWIMVNVIRHLIIQNPQMLVPPNTTYLVGNKPDVAASLHEWLERLPREDGGKHEMWLDCYAYDWVLFCDLFGDAFGIPSCIYYIPFDLATLFKVKGIDPDRSREYFSGMAGDTKHNALWDAQVIKACYEKAINA